MQIFFSGWVQSSSKVKSLRKLRVLPLPQGTRQVSERAHKELYGCRIQYDDNDVAFVNSCLLHEKVLPLLSRSFVTI